jgi:hypothetical protein
MLLTYRLQNGSHKQRLELTSNRAFPTGPLMATLMSLGAFCHNDPKNRIDQQN